jgi:hypothetical protein
MNKKGDFESMRVCFVYVYFVYSEYKRQGNDVGAKWGSIDFLLGKSSKIFDVLGEIFDNSDKHGVSACRKNCA